MDARGSGRRRLLGLGVAGLATACAPTRRAPIDLGPAFATSVRGRGFPGYLDAMNSSFNDHARRPEYSLGGIDYGPAEAHRETLVCPGARGMVIATRDHDSSAGMMLIVAHGLGWKTQYAHLEARFVVYRETVERRDVVAVMGASGQGATRGGLGVARHLHLTLWGPAWSAMLRGVNLQDHPQSVPGYRHALDPEEFSLAGRNSYLPFSRAEDTGPDQAFGALHAEAVRVSDELLDQLGDTRAREARARGRFERETGFDYHVDQRITFLWERLERDTHPFLPDEARAHRATLLRFMSAVPRFTAPIVEPARRAEYRVRRARPVRVFEGRPL